MEYHSCITQVFSPRKPVDGTWEIHQLLHGFLSIGSRNQHQTNRAAWEHQNVGVVTEAQAFGTGHGSGGREEQVTIEEGHQAVRGDQ